MRHLLFIILLMVSEAGLGQKSDATQKKIDRIFAAAGLKAPDVPGAAVLVLKRGEVLFKHGYGVAELSSRAKITPATNFRLASVSKEFTAMAIMLLVHDGKLRYEDRLTDIFPEFPEYGRNITVRELLQHTSGLKDYEELMPAADPKVPVEQIQIQDAGVLELLKRETGTKFTPGTKWDYSNSGYVVLGLVVQKVSGRTFAEFLHERIFAPLEMNNTVAYVRGTNQVANRAFGHSLESAFQMVQAQREPGALLESGSRRIRVRLRQRWAMEESTRRWKIWPNGTGRCVRTR